MGRLPFFKIGKIFKNVIVVKIFDIIFKTFMYSLCYYKYRTYLIFYFCKYSFITFRISLS